MLALFALAAAVAMASVGFAAVVSSPALIHRGAPSRRGLQTLPLGARLAVSRGLGADYRAFWATHGSGALRAAGGTQSLGYRFTKRGALVRTSGGTLELGLRAAGRGSALTAVSPAAPTAVRNRVSYRHRGVVEWYANGPAGLEQGFALASRPAGDAAGPVTLALGLSGGLRPSLAADGQSLTFANASGRAVLRYGGLSVTDAQGRTLRSWLELRGNELLLRLSDAEARYPLTVDPYVQLAKLTASDGAGDDDLGSAVAVSPDGSTVVAGAAGATDGKGPTNQGQGAAYVFTKPSSGWASGTEVAKLTASDGAVDDGLGHSVAVSPDGSTVFAGAPHPGGLVSDQRPGAVYLFTKPSSGWASETEAAKLSASDATQFDHFGYAVAVSSDGSTLVAGAENADGSRGAAYVFAKPSSGWVSGTQVAKLTASDGAVSDGLGSSVAVSSDGSTVIAGAPNATVGGRFGQGAAYVFTEPSSGWASGTQAAKLTASDGAQNDNLGNSVSVSSDGSTVVAGAPTATVGGNLFQGAAYAFSKPSSGWASGTQQAKLTASDGAGDDVFGSSVAMSPDGSTAFVSATGNNSAQGAMYVFGAGTADTDLTIATHPDITAAASSTSGASISYTPPSASDEGGETPTVSCSPESGSTFAVGQTKVTCTATDSDDTPSTAQSTFTVTVTDSDLALHNVPANITTDATSPSGATVSYTPPSATDEGNQSPPVTCNPASGSTFAIGSTTVTCTASATDGDDANSPVTGQFTVAVKGATGQLQDLNTYVNRLGSGTSLSDKTQAALSDYQAGDIAGACSELTQITNEAKAQSGKKLTVTQANTIIADAKRIAAVIGC